MGMNQGSKSIKHGKCKNSTPLRNIINKDRFFKAKVFKPLIKPVNFNRLNRNENKKGSSSYPSYGIDTNDACD